VREGRVDGAGGSEEWQTEGSGWFFPRRELWRAESSLISLSSHTLWKIQHVFSAASSRLFLQKSPMAGCARMTSGGSSWPFLFFFHVQFTPDACDATGGTASLFFGPRLFLFVDSSCACERNRASAHRARCLSAFSTSCVCRGETDSAGSRAWFERPSLPRPGAPKE